MRVVNNFVGSNPVCVSTMRHDQCGNLVSLKQDAAAMSFQHSMKPAQAIELADALMAAAEELEPGILAIRKEVAHA